MNIFEWPMRKRYYIARPWKWVRQLWRNMVEAHQRITKGYCDSDVFNMDSWMLKIMPAMLREMAEKEFSYPGSAPFETPEKWGTWLTGMAERLERLQLPWSDTKNEFEKPYFEGEAALRAASQKSEGGLDVTWVTPTSEEVEELHQKWLARIKELNEEEKKETIDVFVELATYLRLLWM